MIENFRERDEQGKGAKEREEKCVREKGEGRERVCVYGLCVL